MEETLSGDNAFTILGLAELMQVIKGSAHFARALASITDAQRNPERILVVAQLEDLLDRSILVIDKWTAEILELGPRRLRAIKSLSLAGCSFVKATAEGENWLRKRVSSRRFLRDGSIE